MTPSANPITLSVEQLYVVQEQLAELRHEVGNHLSVIVAAAEILQHRPEMAPKMLPTLVDQPKRISDKVHAFSEFLEHTLGLPNLGRAPE